MISPCGIDDQSTCANVIRLRDDPLSRHARRPEKRGKPRYPGSEATRNVANPDSLAAVPTKTALPLRMPLSKCPARQDDFLTSVRKSLPSKRLFLRSLLPLRQANGFSYDKPTAVGHRQFLPRSAANLDGPSTCENAAHLINGSLTLALTPQTRRRQR